MTATMDPAPRSYPPFVTLVRRSARGAACAPGVDTIDEIERWLIADAIRERDLLALFEALAWRLVAAGVPLDRASLHVGTLHPNLQGYAWNWAKADGLCDEIKVSEAALQSEGYLRAPLYRVIGLGEVFRGDPRDPDLAARYPMLSELAALGITDYVAFPHGSGESYHHAMTIATTRAEGFSDADETALRRVLDLLALHVERHIVLRIAANVLDTYLGQAAGRQVLDGSIARGSGQPIRAIIWASDLRGFTLLTERLDGPDVIAVLNAYFERMAGAVLAHGGEVLKFIGDGLLAVFPLTASAEAPVAARAALAAARQALSELDVLNAAADGPLAGIQGWRPLRTGIALNEGEVFFGNVGAAERLDFTVIGRAVNATSRAEALCAEVGRSILLTQAVAELVDEELDDLGEHVLKGVARPMRVFGVR